MINIGRRIFVQVCKKKKKKIILLSLLIYLWYVLIDIEFISKKNSKDEKVEALFKHYLNFIFNVVFYHAAYLSDYGAQAI